MALAPARSVLVKHFSVIAWKQTSFLTICRITNDSKKISKEKWTVLRYASYDKEWLGLFEGISKSEKRCKEEEEEKTPTQKQLERWYLKYEIILCIRGPVITFAELTIDFPIADKNRDSLNCNAKWNVVAPYSTARCSHKTVYKFTFPTSIVHFDVLWGEERRLSEGPNWHMRERNSWAFIFEMFQHYKGWH